LDINHEFNMIFAHTISSAIIEADDQEQIHLELCCKLLCNQRI
jgi:hypothetical protein